MTQYSILQAIISPRTDERINIGVLMSDGKQTSWMASNQKLNILRQWRGEAAYRMVKRISDGLEKNEQLRQEVMQPGMRLASPMVCGRMRVSFWRASVERDWMLL